jgi:Flp pilus assembly protein TadD
VSAEIHNDLGVALAKLGRLEDAVVHFRHAVRLDPEFRAAKDNIAKPFGGSSAPR